MFSALGRIYLCLQDENSLSRRQRGRISLTKLSCYIIKLARHINKNILKHIWKNISKLIQGRFATYIKLPTILSKSGQSR